jgi:DNA-binding LacI/PurR family transcriptional regulator
VCDAVARYADVEVVTASEADTLEGGRRAARSLLDRSPGLTALVRVNDVMAVGTLRELRAQGRRVPDDVSVTGFDDVTLAQFCSRP